LNDPRPREYAQPITDEVIELIRKRLEGVPVELRPMTADHIVSSVWIYWETKKAKAGRRG
jgi:hypothetical protein